MPPAESEAQRKFLNATKGHAWVKKHGFANKGHLPDHLSRKGEHLDNHKRKKRIVPKKDARGFY